MSELNYFTAYNLYNILMITKLGGFYCSSSFNFCLIYVLIFFLHILYSLYFIACKRKSIFWNGKKYTLIRSK